MNIFVLHMFLVVGVVLCVAIVLLSGGGKSTLYISSGDGTEKSRRVRRAAPIPVENYIFGLIGVGCAIALYFTNFNLCTFLGYWFPALNLNMLQGVCGLK